MPRRKPISSKQRKVELQQKRAVKRGDAPQPQNLTEKRAVGRGNGPYSARREQLRARKLESAFTKLSKEWLERAKEVATNTVLQRPIPQTAAIFPLDLCRQPPESALKPLSCPRRPKWRYEMTKKEVERNEEGLFAKWINEVDTSIEQWQRSGEDKSNGGDKSGRSTRLHSTTYFERNLEVWRQLWRVTEMSHILLVLLDCRVPLVHYPPSLHEYLASLRPPRQIILVLTKTDIVGPDRVQAWRQYFSAIYPSYGIVEVESYVEREMRDETQGKRRYFDPHIPDSSLVSLVAALKSAHQELIRPVNELQSGNRQTWKPPIKEEIDWNLLLKGIPPSSGHQNQGETLPEAVPPNESGSEVQQFTIGLIGQPNVGKSSLLNALFGSSKVRASRTPGKTKHFQTFFWTPDVRLVDCPGLVMPALVPMELQVLAATLPISRISSISSCVHFASELLPLETILNLEHPERVAKVDKRTWRNPDQQTEVDTKENWTPMDILTAYAVLKGWVTAKAGRPDVNRAGNAILRQLAESRTRWGFWPPGCVTIEGSTHVGIWIPHDRLEIESDSEESEQTASVSGDDPETELDIDSGGDDDDTDGSYMNTTATRFSVLSLE